MTKEEAYQTIDVLRAHSAANLYLDLNSLGENVCHEINYIGIFDRLNTASYDELADLLYLAVIEEVLK